MTIQLDRIDLTVSSEGLDGCRDDLVHTCRVGYVGLEGEADSGSPPVTIVAFPLARLPRGSIAFSLCQNGKLDRLHFAVNLFR